MNGMSLFGSTYSRENFFFKWPTFNYGCPMIIFKILVVMHMFINTINGRIIVKKNCP